MRRDTESARSVMFEELEPRLLLAAAFTANVVKGDLLISHQSFTGGDVQVGPGGAPGSYTVTGLSGSTVNGGVADVVTGVTGDVEIRTAIGPQYSNIQY